MNKNNDEEDYIIDDKSDHADKLGQKFESIRVTKILGRKIAAMNRNIWVRCQCEDCGTVTERKFVEVKHNQKGARCFTCNPRKYKEPDSVDSPTGEVLKYKNEMERKFEEGFKKKSKKEISKIALLRKTYNSMMARIDTGKYRVNAEWDKFEGFLKSFEKGEIGGEIFEGMTLDRKDSRLKVYGPNKCHLVTHAVQCANKINNKFVFYKDMLICRSQAQRLSIDLEDSSLIDYDEAFEKYGYEKILKGAQYYESNPKIERNVSNEKTNQLEERFNFNQDKIKELREARETITRKIKYLEKSCISISRTLKDIQSGKSKRYKYFKDDSKK